MREIDRLTPRIYDAVWDESAWPDILSDVAEALEIRGAMMIAFDQTASAFHVDAWSDFVKGEEIAEYKAMYGHYDEQGFTVLTMLGAERMRGDHEIWNDPDLEDREDFRYLDARLGIRNRAAVRLSERSGVADMLALQLPSRWDPSAAVRHAVDAVLVPNLSKALAMQRMASVAGLRTLGAVAALDRLRIGVCVCAPDGLVAHANAAAIEILEARDGVSLSRSGRLQLREPAEQRSFEAALSRVASVVRDGGLAPEATLRASRLSRATPYLIDLAPFHDLGGAIERRDRGVMAFIFDADLDAGLTSRGLGAVFALTPAELAVCQEILQGRKTGEIAERRGVTRETVRSQVRSIFVKTGVGTRAGLVRLAARISPPVFTHGAASIVSVSGD